MLFQTDKKATRILTNVAKKTGTTQGRALANAIVYYQWIVEQQSKKHIIVALSPKGKKAKFMQVLFDCTQRR